MKGLWHKYAAEYRRLLMLGAPILVTQLSVIVMAFSDTLMVGRYSVSALAAAAFVNNLYLIPNVMLMGLASGVTPLVGALYSQGRRERAGRVTRAAMRVNLAVGLVFTAVMGVIYFFLDHFGQDPAILPQVRSYYLLLLCVPVSISLYSVLMQMSNGVEHTSLPMIVTVVCIGLNILGNWLLIYGVAGLPELGLFGAGAATVASRWLSVLGMWLAFDALKRYREYKKGYFISRRLGKTCLKVWATSWPVMLQSGCECGLWAFGGVVCGWFGAVQLAAYQVTNTIGQLGFMIYMSFAAAVAIRVAYFAGLKDEEGAGRVARAGMHINIILATAASLVFIFASSWLIPMFVRTGPEATDGMAVVTSATALILPLVFYQYFDATQLTLCNAIRGTSQVRPLFVISFVSYMIVGVPMLLLLARVLGLGNVGAYWSFNVSLVVASIMAVIFFKRIRFK